MSCNCKNTDGFKKALNDALQIENRSGISYGIFVNKTNGKVYFGIESEIKKRTDICCYFKTNGEEVVIPKKPQNKPKKPKVVVDEVTQTKED